jgi:hypothetical protein
MANPELVALLAKGVDAWNKWREENTRYTGWPNLDSNPAGKPDLTNWDGEILRNFDMKRFVATYVPAPQEMPVISDLSKKPELRRYGWANLDDANLTWANISSANLTELSLNRANLFGANLSYANLNFTELTGASLIGANLSEASLERADLRGANLTRTNLSKANLKGANLEGAILVEAD